MATLSRPWAWRNSLLTTLLLALCAWLVWLAGLAALQARCNETGSPAMFAGVGELAPAPLSCRHFYAYQWWKVIYHLLVFALIAAALGLARYHVHRAALAALLAVGAVLAMDATNAFFIAWLLNGDAGEPTTHAKVFYAGSLATAALDLLLIFVVGTHEEEGDSLDATGAWDPRWQPGWGEWGAHGYGGRRRAKPGTVEGIPPTTAATTEVPVV